MVDKFLEVFFDSHWNLLMGVFCVADNEFEIKSLMKKDGACFEDVHK